MAVTSGAALDLKCVCGLRKPEHLRFLCHQVTRGHLLGIMLQLSSVSPTSPAQQGVSLMS